MMNHSLKGKLVIVVSTISIGAIAVVAIAILIQFTAAMNSQTADNNQQVLTQLAANMDTYLDEVYRLTLSPYYYNDILNELRTTPPEDAYERLKRRRRITEFINAALVYSRKDIRQVYIIADELYFSHMDSAPENPSYQDMVASGWYRRAMTENEDMFVVLSDDSRFSDATYFSVVNTIKDSLNNYHPIGVIKVDANFQKLRELCNSVNMGAQGGIAILSEENEIIYTNMPAVSPDDLRTIMTRGSRSFDGFMVNIRPLEHFGWTLVGLNDLGALRRAISNSQRMIVLCIIFTTLLTGFLLYRMITIFFKPFYRVIDLMKTVEKGERTARYAGAGQDEVGYLGMSMNQMLDNLDAMYERMALLDQQVYRANLFQRETQIQLLYSQIRPHFLYNTLNMISILIQQNQHDSAIRCINHLGMILRGVAYINKEVPLKTELALNEAYLAIQQMRYGERLSYAIDVDARIMGMQVPALLIQPIVENAVVHGCEETTGVIHIRISGEYERDTIILSVIDNGPGMQQEKLDALMQNIYSQPDADAKLVDDLEEMRGLGLANVHARLHCRYGPRAGLRVESKAGDGTIIRIVIPDQDIADTRAVEEGEA